MHIRARQGHLRLSSGQAQWLTPVIPKLWEAKAGESQEPPLQPPGTEQDAPPRQAVCSALLSLLSRDLHPQGCPEPPKGLWTQTAGTDLSRTEKLTSVLTYNPCGPAGNRHHQGRMPLPSSASKPLDNAGRGDTSSFTTTAPHCTPQNRPHTHHALRRAGEGKQRGEPCNPRERTWDRGHRARNRAPCLAVEPTVRPPVKYGVKQSTWERFSNFNQLAPQLRRQRSAPRERRVASPRGPASSKLNPHSDTPSYAPRRSPATRLPHPPFAPGPRRRPYLRAQPQGTAIARTGPKAAVLRLLAAASPVRAGLAGRAVQSPRQSSSEWPGPRARRRLL
ncbi:hypothetical protein AAY473_000437 [Plecturocebus cupreus]